MLRASGSVFMFVSSAAPNKRSLGAMNGLAQTIVSTQRALGPAAATSLFAFSLQNNILGGHFSVRDFACSSGHWAVCGLTISEKYLEGQSYPLLWRIRMLIHCTFWLSSTSSSENP